MTVSGCLKPIGNSGYLSLTDVAQYNGVNVSECELYRNEITVPADLPELNRVSMFVGNILDTLQCSKQTQIHIRIAVDEIFSNIARHSDARKGDTVTVLVHAEEPRTVVITFMDSSSRFNPLSVGEPDVTAPAHKRQVGGLGLYMVKKMMDDVSYEYRDEQNILTIKKKI